MISDRTTFIAGAPRLLSYLARRVTPSPRRSHSATTHYTEWLNSVSVHLAQSPRCGKVAEVVRFVSVVPVNLESEACSILPVVMF